MPKCYLEHFVISKLLCYFSLHRIFDIAVSKQQMFHLLLARLT
jgi:hypothetical protein